MDKREIMEAIEHAQAEIDKVAEALGEKGKIQLSKKAYSVLWDLCYLLEKVDRSAKV